MTPLEREMRLALIGAVLIVLALAWVGRVEAQGLAELAAALEECPAPPPPRPVPPYDVRVTMSLGSGRAWVTGDHLDLSAQPGILNRVGGGSCWISQATVTSGLTGEVSEQDVLVPQSCEPVPEPGFGVGLAVGVVALAMFIGSPSALPNRRSPRPASGGCASPVCRSGSAGPRGVRDYPPVRRSLSRAAYQPRHRASSSPVFAAS